MSEQSLRTGRNIECLEALHELNDILSPEFAQTCLEQGKEVFCKELETVVPELNQLEKNCADKRFYAELRLFYQDLVEKTGTKPNTV